MATERTSEGPTVLVADDDLELLGLVARTAQRHAGQVLEASDGQEALRLARENQPNLIVLDVMMPGMSGWEVCRAVRDEDSLDGTRVLMLTGIGERLNEMTSPLYGADDYLDKPFELEELDAKIQELLGGAGS
jgi:DNA-binding response OmpR family regulator